MKTNWVGEKCIEHSLLKSRPGGKWLKLSGDLHMERRINQQQFHIQYIGFGHVFPETLASRLILTEK